MQQTHEESLAHFNSIREWPSIEESANRSTSGQDVTEWPLQGFPSACTQWRSCATGRILSTAIAKPSLTEADFQRLAVTLRAADNYVIKMEGTAFEDDVDANRLAAVLSPIETTRDSEWASKALVRMDDIAAAPFLRAHGLHMHLLVAHGRQCQRRPMDAPTHMKRLRCRLG